MAFRLVKNPSDTAAEYVTISSLALAVGDVIELDVGATAWTIANASTEHWQLKRVVMEITDTNDTEVKAILVNDQQVWDVDGDSTSDSGDNGDRMLLSATAGRVQNTSSDNTSEEACFIQDAPVGASSDNRLIGHLIGGTGVNPDAS